MTTRWTSPTTEILELHGPGKDGKEFKGRPDQRPERVLVDRVALVEVDGAPGVAIEARVEETCRVLQ